MNELDRELARMEDADPAVRRGANAIDAAGELIRKACRERDRADAAEALVDRLVRALARADVLITKDNLGQQCTVCGESSHFFTGTHAEDCMKVWATEHIAALEGQ